ncbi:MAG: hypothetical protein ACHQ1G_07055 [Planctomycetota bacterium]
MSRPIRKFLSEAHPRVMGRTDWYLLLCIVATLVLSWPIAALLPLDGDLAVNLFLLGAAGTVIVTRLRRLIYAAKEELRVAPDRPSHRTREPEIDFLKYAGLDPEGTPPPKPRRRRKR